MTNLLGNKIAVVTGASSGIGRAIALAFHREGATVVCADLSELGSLKTAMNGFGGEGTVTTHETILNEGGSALFVRTDVTVASEVEGLIRQVVEKFGRLDIMVNNAGIAAEAVAPQPIWELDEDLWDKTMRVNSKGVFLGCKYAMGQMIKQEPGATGDRGWIINMASIAGTVGVAGAPSYCASKHAVVGITRAAALDCGPQRIHCNAICPGWIDTPLTHPTIKQVGTELGKLHPFRGLGKPDDIAKAAVFLASENNTWMTGSIVSVDGGYSCA